MLQEVHQRLRLSHSWSLEETGSLSPHSQWVGKGGCTFIDCLPPHAQAPSQLIDVSPLSVITTL